MSKQDPFQTIDPTALAQVSGGAAAATSGDSDAVLNALDSILDSIKSISGSQNQGGFGATEMMMFMLMLGNRNQPQYLHTGQQVPFTCGTGPVVLK